MAHCIIFTFLFFCLSQPIYSMKKNDEGYFSYFYNLVNKYSYRRTSYDPFCHAVKLAYENRFAQENCEEIKKYILNGANPNWKIGIGEDENTVLKLAVCYQQKDLFNFLLQHKADINVRDEIGETPLYYLVWGYGNFYKKLDIDIKDLIQHGANINTTNIYGLTPLHVAVFKRNINCIKSLVECGADINGKATGKSINMTPLEAATRKDFTIEESTIMTPLAIAIQKEAALTAPIEVIKELCKLKASLVEDDDHSIFHYILAFRGDDSIKYIKPIITHARFDSYKKGSQTVPYGLFLLKRWETKNMITLPRDVKLHILSKLPPSDLYPYKKLCKELLQKNYIHILLPQVCERVENIKQILAKKSGKNQAALELMLEEFANNQELINEARPLLDGTLLQKNFNDFIEYFPAIVNSDLEEDKDNLVRQMFDNCAELFLEQ